LGDLKLGIATQNMVIQKTRNAKPAYYSNVALKINCKLKGINFKLAANSLPGLERDVPLIMGKFS
jgi:eukaryotic translation initiation factor 2C